MYLCDRRACDKCMSTCEHTTNIEHADSFVADEFGNYWEESVVDIAIERAKGFLIGFASGAFIVLGLLAS